MKPFKTIFILFCIICAIGCGPSPESMAKKYCDLFKKYQEAEKNKDAMNILKYSDELVELNKKIQNDHKGNNDWLMTYELEKDACMLEAMKTQSK